MGRKKVPDVKLMGEEAYRDLGPTELQLAISQLPSDGAVIILQRVNEQGRSRYLSKITPSDFDLETIKQTC